MLFEAVLKLLVMNYFLIKEINFISSKHSGFREKCKVGWMLVFPFCFNGVANITMEIKASMTGAFGRLMECIFGVFRGYRIRTDLISIEKSRQNMLF